MNNLALVLQNKPSEFLNQYLTEAENLHLKVL